MLPQAYRCVVFGLFLCIHAPDTLFREQGLSIYIFSVLGTALAGASILNKVLSYAEMF